MANKPAEMVNTKDLTGEGSVSFKCPSCNKVVIYRTMHQRQIASKYVCPVCSFEGPN